MGLETIIFIIVGAIAIAAAAGMLFSPNAVHSALFLILNLACVAFFYLMLSAPFMAMVQITVYAGAIMVLFLFVIMLLGAERLRQSQTEITWQVPVAFALTALFLVTALIAIFSGEVPLRAEVSDLETASYGGPAQVGEELFASYVLPFEMVAVLLLVAIIGAVVLSHEEGYRGRRKRGRRAPREPLTPAGPTEAAETGETTETIDTAQSEAAGD